MAATKRGVRDYIFWINGKLYDEIESLVEADIKEGNNRANLKAFLTEVALRLVYLRKGEVFTDYRTEIRKYTFFSFTYSVSSTLLFLINPSITID